MVYGDNEIDGVEVFIASEAAREIGVWINSSVESGAKRTEETQEGIAKRVRELQAQTNEIGNWDVVSKCAESFRFDPHFLEVFFPRSACFRAARSSASLALKDSPSMVRISDL